MRQIVVLSGKGGTGKTSVTAALAHLASRSDGAVMVDADVDAANLGLTLRPTILERHEFSGGMVATVDDDACVRCGECVEACRFGGMTGPGVIHELDCEGCAACVQRCPAKGLVMRPAVTGEWFESDTRFGRLFHARLFPGRENSGKLVTAVRAAGRDHADAEGIDLVLIDGPPGIGCPVIAASTGVDLALIVTEPTISGAADLERALGTVTHFGIPALVVVNKADLNPAWADRIEGLVGEAGIELAARIPFDPEVTRAMVNLLTVTEAGSGPAAVAIEGLWAELRQGVLT